MSGLLLSGRQKSKCGYPPSKARRQLCRNRHFGIAKDKKAARKAAKDITETASLGTTPRQITDLISSLSDLTTGSGDRQTPVVLIKNYL